MGLDDGRGGGVGGDEEAEESDVRDEYVLTLVLA